MVIARWRAGSPVAAVVESAPGVITAEQVARHLLARGERAQTLQVLQGFAQFVEFLSPFRTQLVARPGRVVPHLAHAPAQPGRSGWQAFRAEYEQPGNDEYQQLSSPDVLEHVHASRSLKRQSLDQL